MLYQIKEIARGDAYFLDRERYEGSFFQSDNDKRPEFEFIPKSGFFSITGRIWLSDGTSKRITFAAVKLEEVCEDISDY